MSVTRRAEEAKNWPEFLRPFASSRDPTLLARNYMKLNSIKAIQDAPHKKSLMRASLRITLVLLSFAASDLIRYQSLGANPLRLIGLAWLNSIPLVSTFRGWRLAHSIQVVTPGRASSRAGAIGFPQRLHGLTEALISWVMEFTARILGNLHAVGAKPLIGRLIHEPDCRAPDSIPAGSRSYRAGFQHTAVLCYIPTDAKTSRIS
jgi:hypothetical protein